MNKKKKIDDDFIDDELEDFIDEPIEDSIDKLEEELDLDPQDDIIEIEDDELLHSNAAIEIEEEDIHSDDVIEIVEIDDEDIKNVIKEDPLSKHTAEGKHSLKYDSIFKGKKEDPLSEDDLEVSPGYTDVFEVDRSSIYWSESIDNENYVKEKRIKERVYEVLLNNTDINFLNNRRKPSRSDFNKYYYLLKVHLKSESFTNVELFNELAVYFSDNLFNMFKLLDNKWRNMIISELQTHIGKQTNSNEIRNRNIYVETEIEFVTDDINNPGDLIHVTGVVTEVDYDQSRFKVNSYEKIYDIHISDITKILNNTKFKYNLNKLDGIDFL